MKPVQYDDSRFKQLANNGWQKIADYKHEDTIYQQYYLPDYSVCWKGHEWTGQKAYDRSKEELGMALNPQEMY